MKLILSALILFGSMPLYAQSLLQTTRGNKFNPGIGMNALTLFQNSARDTETDGFSLQEIEMQFSSDVDAYFRAEATLSLHPEHSEEEEEEDDAHDHTSYSIEPEVVFMETTSVPGVTLRAGLLYAQFAKYNEIHTHAQPFIKKSQLQEYMFGDEPFSETGASASFLAPLVPWFSEVTLQVMQPTNSEVLVDAHHTLAYLARVKNLWEFGDELTMEFTQSFLKFSAHSHGSEIEDGTNMYGLDLTFKWKPLKNGRASAFMWSTEFMHKDRNDSVTTKNGGVTSFMRYQFLPRWYAQAQYEFIGLGKNEDLKDLNAYAALVGFVPTEFSAVRAQFESIHDGAEKPEKRVSLQVNVSIGAHPAHLY